MDVKICQQNNLTQFRPEIGENFSPIFVLFETTEQFFLILRELVYNFLLPFSKNFVVTRQWYRV